MSSDERPLVAYDATPLLGIRTGIGRSVADTVEALERSGRVGLLPYVLGARAPGDAVAGARHVRVPTRVLLAAWTRTDRPRLDRLLAGADVVHATNFLVAPSRLPTLVTVHDCSFALFPETVGDVVAQFGAVLRRAVDRGVHLHVTTEHVAGEVEELYGPGLRAAGRLHVVPFGIPALGAAAGAPPRVAALGGAPFVLALGRVEPRKNHARLVRAFGAVATGSADLRLVLAGPPGPAAPAVTAEVDALPPGVRERVHVLGTVTEPERRALLEHASALAYPSLYEGFGFPVLEAMALGTPVLASSTGAVAEVAGGAAQLVDPLDEDALAAGLRALVDDGGRRDELVALGRSRAAGFSWERTADGLADVLSGMAQRR